MLTELAVPSPAAQDDGIPDTYEREMERAKTSSSISQREDEGDGGLTELTMPAPISRDEETGYAASTNQTQGERLTGIQHYDSSSGDPIEQQATQRPTHRYSIYAEFCTISWLIFFAILGTLARLGVQTISTYPNAPFLSPVLWANLGGSLFLGFLLEDRRLFRYTVEVKDSEKDLVSEIDKAKKTMPLYIGLATGFCGSFTSFSTFITDAFLALSNTLPPPSAIAPYHISQASVHARNGGFSFMATTGILIVQTAVSIGALKAGAHIAVAVEPVFPSLPVTFLHRFLDPLSIPLGWGCWLGAAFLTIWPPSNDWRYRATFALVFAPPGALLRFFLSRHLNARIPAFPLGTFIANMLGTMSEGMCMDLQHSSAIVAGATNMAPCAALEGVMSGFCGCTSTVSTWVAELNGLRRSHAWFYGLASVAVALAVQVVIMGTMMWTVGYDHRCSQTAR